MAPRKRGPKKKPEIPGPQKPAAQSKLTEKNIDLIAGMLRRLVPLEVAARACGISRQTLYNWRKRGKADAAEEKDTLYARFFYVAEEAEAQGEVLTIQKVYEAGPQFQLALLRSRFPTRWSETQRLQVEMESMQNEMLDALKEGLEPDEYRKVIAVLRSHGGE